MKSAAVRICLIALIAFSMPFGEAPLFSQDKTGTEELMKDSVRASSGFGMKYIELQLQMDVDRDEIITQDEWNRLFAKLDENGDGRLSMKEMQKALSDGDTDEEADSDAGRIAAFERFDGNGNGAIDSSEWAGKKRSFRYLDTNRNGSVSREEFMSRNARWWNQVFENIDLNGNGLITRLEWIDSDASFDRLDRNRNGFIERSEFYNPR